MADYDKNLFFDNQLYNSKISWQLFAQEPAVGGGNKDEYDTKPILRGIVYDPEIGFSGSHDFGQSELLSGLGNKVGFLMGAANSLSEGTAIGKALGKGVSDILGIDVSTDAVTKLVSQFSEKGGDILGNVFSKAGSRFTSAFDFIKVFKGTGLEIDIPPLETRIYHKVIDKKNVEDVIRGLVEKFVGELVSTTVEKIDNILGIQAPPNNYVPEFRVISGNHHVPGSFLLKYGPYSIDNLLVTNFSYRLSTFRVREMSGGGDSYDINSVVPKDTSLYADVRIGVQPCTYISRNTLMKIMGSAEFGPSESKKKSFGVLKEDKKPPYTPVVIDLPTKPKSPDVKVPMKI